MFWIGNVLLRRICLRALLSLLALALCTSLFPSTAAGQWFNHDPDLYGYVTAVHSPTSFDVDLVPVTTAAGTTYGLFGDKNPTANSPLRNAIRVGVYVHVSWLYDDSKKKSPAVTVLLRDDWDKQLSGVGVIDKVIATGAEPVFEADGYRIRIGQKTQVSFQGKLKELTGVGTGTLVEYEGVRDATGDLVASKATFVPVDAKKFIPVEKPVGQVPVPSGGAIVDTKGILKSPHTKVRYEQSNSTCGWVRVPDDAALQARVQRVGMKLIPAYQKQLAAGDAAKIDFRFYAVDAPKYRTDPTCPPAPGLVLVPEQVVERLRNDDQLAAMLAVGIAFNLQWQVVKQTENTDLARFIEAENDVLAVWSPMGIVIDKNIVAPLAFHSLIERWREEQLRIELSLMEDAGYDPWQAPEAWRLLAAKKLTADTNSLQYPSAAGYQLGVLSLQYRKSGAAASN